MDDDLKRGMAVSAMIKAVDEVGKCLATLGWFHHGRDGHATVGRHPDSFDTKYEKVQNLFAFGIMPIPNKKWTIP